MLRIVLRMVCLILLVRVFLVPVPAEASGIPVFDATNVLHAIEQVKKQIEQIEMLKSQLEESQKLYESLNAITDIKDVAKILKSDQVHGILPEDIAQIQGALSGVLGQNFQDLSKRYAHYEPSSSEANNFYYRELARRKGETYRDMAIGQTVYEAAAKRASGLTQLRERLGTAATQKEVLDLQVRLSAESALLQNELLQMQALAMMQSARLEVNTQREMEERARFFDNLGELVSP